MIGLIENFVKVRLSMSMDVTVLGLKGELKIEGPRDADKDGDPEFLVSLSGPGVSVPPTSIEVPVSVVSGPLAGLIAFAVSKITRQ